MSESDHTDRTANRGGGEARIDALVGHVLLGGVVASVTLIVAGVAWRWLNTGHLGIDYTLPKLNLFGFVTAEIREVSAGRFRPRLLVSLGIVALVLTPYVRVLASLIFFALVERNWKYSVFTGFVLAVLTYSLFLR
jgi:uncharacterized membrane protein